MNILSIDTCFPACMVGIVAPHTTQSRVIPMTRGQAEQLIPMVMDVVAQAGLTIADLNLIVVNIGPGSFTGVRVGLAAAQGLALPHHIPVQGVTSLDALHHHAIPSVHPGTVAVDTGRQDFFIYDYLTPDDMCDPGQIRIAATRPAGAITEQTALTIPDYPVTLARLGARIFADTTHPHHGLIAPVYVRPPETSTAKKSLSGPITPSNI